MPRRILATLLVILLATAPVPATAQAQSNDRAALVIGAPTLIGMQFPLSSRLTLRPDFNYTRQVFSAFGSSTTLHGLGLGLSMLHFLSEADGVRPYIVPRLGYSRSWMTEEGGPDSELYSLSGALGAQARITGRFGAFAEAGLELQYGEGSGPVPTITRRWGTLTRVGATVGF